MIVSILSYDERVECERLFKFFSPFAAYSEADSNGVSRVVGLLEDAPKEAIAAYTKWDSIVRPRDENGGRILV